MFISPVLLTVILVAALIDWTKPSYGSIQYPEWAHSIGWFLLAISVLQIPAWFLLSLVLHYSGTKWFSTNPLRPARSWEERREGGGLAATTVTNVSVLNGLGFRHFTVTSVVMKFSS